MAEAKINPSRDKLLRLLFEGREEWNTFVKEHPNFDVDFSNVNFPKEFSKFRNQPMNDELSFAGYEFPNGDVSFANSKFSTRVCDFKNMTFGAGLVDFTNVEFSFKAQNPIDKALDFSGVKFGKGNKLFAGAVFYAGEVNFENTNFDIGEVDFSKCKFPGQSVSFKHAVFGEGDVNFSECEFSNEKSKKLFPKLSPESGGK